MRSNQQRNARGWGRWLGLTAIGWVLSGCTPIPSVNNPYAWPATTVMAIWAVEPSVDTAYGFDGRTLVLRWNRAEPNGTDATVSVRLVPIDANKPSQQIVTGLQVDTWVFDGRDANGQLVPAQTYEAEYILDDGAGTTVMDRPAGTIIVPLRFNAPGTDVTIFQTAGLTVEWEFPTDAGALGRLDIGLTVDPNDGNDIVWLSHNGWSLGAGETPASFEFDGTVYDATNQETDTPNSFIVEPGTYFLVGKILVLNLAGDPLTIQGPGRITILEDPNI